MTKQEKKFVDVYNELKQLNPEIVLMLCAKLIISVEPEMFKWNDLKEKLLNPNQEELNAKLYQKKHT